MIFNLKIKQPASHFTIWKNPSKSLPLIFSSFLCPTHLCLVRNESVAGWESRAQYILCGKNMEVVSYTVIESHHKKSHLIILRAKRAMIIFQLLNTFMVPISAVCLHFITNQLFVNISETNVNYLFTFVFLGQLFVYISDTNISCLFTFLKQSSVVCLHFWDKVQLFVYISEIRIVILARKFKYLINQCWIVV